MNSKVRMNMITAMRNIIILKALAVPTLKKVNAGRTQQSGPPTWRTVIQGSRVRTHTIQLQGL